MQTRKLQQVGGGTYTVSIPKDWADDHRLEAGMELYLYRHSDDSIVVRAVEKDVDELGAATVEIDGDDPALVRRALRAAHAAGFETVTLVPGDGFTDEQRRAARSVVRTLVGTDLLVETGSEITVQHLLDAASVSVGQSVVQLQFTALSIHRAATDALVEADPDAHERLSGRADEADRLFRMVARHVSRSLVSLEEVDRLGVSRPVLFDHYVTARQLDRVARQGVGVARAARRLPDPLPEPVAETVRAAAEAGRAAVGSATTAVLDGADGDQVDDALDNRDAALAEVAAVERLLFDESATPFDGSTAAAVALARAAERLGRTADCGGAIAEAAARAATRSENV